MPGSSLLSQRTVYEAYIERKLPRLPVVELPGRWRYPGAGGSLSLADWPIWDGNILIVYVRRGRQMHLAGVDVGGTFTDIALYDGTGGC